MRITFYGVRGSIPVSDPACQEFGGNTTCILLKGPQNDIGILDAGTGIRNLGKELLSNQDKYKLDSIFIAFSHFHWDHIQGFPFFAPAYDKDREITISAMGKDRQSINLESIFSMQMQKEYFPIPLGKMGASFIFHQPNADIMKESGVTVKAYRHNHPGGAYSYRIVNRFGKIVTYCTDIEHGDSIDHNIVELAKDSDLLIHEAQYTTEQLEQKRGWGHSSYDQALEVAEQANVKQLVITHHDPDHDDAFLRQMEKQCQDRFPDSVLAREGMELQL